MIGKAPQPGQRQLHHILGAGAIIEGAIRQPQAHRLKRAHQGIEGCGIAGHQSRHQQRQR